MIRPDSRMSAVLALLLLVPAPSLGVYIAMMAAQGQPLGWTAYALCKVWIIALPVLWLVFVDKGKLSLSPVRQGGLRFGLGLGALMLLAILVTYHFAGDLIDIEQLRRSNAANGLDTPVRFLLLVIPLTLVNSLLEEYVWRWFVFRKCEALIGGVPAAFAAGLLFTVHHVFALKAQTTWEITALGSLGVFLAGTLWSWCYWRFRSIWPGYLRHALADVGIYIVGWMMLFGSAGA